MWAGSSLLLSDNRAALFLRHFRVFTDAFPSAWKAFYPNPTLPPYVLSTQLLIFLQTTAKPLIIRAPDTDLFSEIRDLFSDRCCPSHRDRILEGQDLTHPPSPFHHWRLAHVLCFENGTKKTSMSMERYPSPRPAVSDLSPHTIPLGPLFS